MSCCFWPAPTVMDEGLIVTEPEAAWTLRRDELAPQELKPKLASRTRRICEKSTTARLLLDTTCLTIRGFNDESLHPAEHVGRFPKLTSHSE
jgi:hypothetical protein